MKKIFYILISALGAITSYASDSYLEVSTPGGKSVTAVFLDDDDKVVEKVEISGEKFGWIPVKPSVKFVSFKTQLRKSNKIPIIKGKNTYVNLDFSKRAGLFTPKYVIEIKQVEERERVTQVDSDSWILFGLLDSDSQNSVFRAFYVKKENLTNIDSSGELKFSDSDTLKGTNVIVDFPLVILNKARDEKKGTLRPSQVINFSEFIRVEKKVYGKFQMAPTGN